MTMKLHVSIKQDDISEHVWAPMQLIRYLAGVMWSRGVTLCIHGSDGTRIEVSPKCERCGSYNTIKPIKDGKCIDCRT